MALTRRFRPGWGASLVTLIGVVTLIGLGVWQLQRLEWKRALLDDIAQRTDAPPVTLPLLIDSPEDWRYRRIVLRGTFAHGREQFLAFGRGWQVVTPLIRLQGPPVLVLRGMVPPDQRDPATRQAGQPAGMVRVEGVVRLPEDRPAFAPDNTPLEKSWYWRDLDGMAQATGFAHALPVFVQATTQGPGDYPRATSPNIDIPNNHLQYALTWFALAVALIVVFAVYGRRQAKGDESRQSDENILD